LQSINQGSKACEFIQLQSVKRSMQQEDMGPLEAWQIREFPRELRQAIVNEAKARRMSPGEFATRVFVAARDAGWDSFAPPTGGVVTNGSVPPKRVDAPDALSRLIAAACELAAADERLPDYLRSGFNRRLQEQQRALAPSRPSRQRRLPAPNLSPPPASP
jgi:hypothetical protein